MSGRAPFNLPWMTFLSFVLVGISILISIIWASLSGRKR